MQKLRTILDRILMFVTVTLFLVMVAVTTWQVISRYILSDPSSITEEFLKYSLIWLSMLAAAYAVGKKSHIAFTLLSDRLKPQRRKSVNILIELCFVAFAVIIMIYGGGKAVSLTMAQLSPSLQLPMGIVYLSLPVAGIFITIYSIINVYELATSAVKADVHLNDVDGALMPDEILLYDGKIK